MSKKQKPFQFVANNFMLRHFRKVKVFKLELGFSLKQLSTKPGEEVKMKIKDQFSKTYENVTNGRLIHKYGSIGSIEFYDDSQLPRNEFHIYKDDKVYEIEASEEDLKINAEKYLVDVIKMVSGEKKEREVDEDSGMIKNMIYSNAPEELNAPSMKLPKDQYIDALIKRRETIEKIKKQK
ncbi:MAG: hypothetical protein KAG14_03935 [Mycoplasmataceae bacterium]|nr:hypothetical protein [Mycoplasmataceae bacterium]